MRACLLKFRFFFLMTIIVAVLCDSPIKKKKGGWREGDKELPSWPDSYDADQCRDGQNNIDHAPHVASSLV